MLIFIKYFLKNIKKYIFVKKKFQSKFFHWNVEKKIFQKTKTKKEKNRKY